MLVIGVNAKSDEMMQVHQKVLQLELQQRPAAAPDPRRRMLWREEENAAPGSSVSFSDQELRLAGPLGANPGTVLLETPAI